MMPDVDNLNWPLMKGNFAREDLDAAIALLQQDDPILTQSREVAAFEEEWSQWLGVRHSVFVSSGSAANLITVAALREISDPGEVVVPTITWVSDIVSVLAAGFACGMGLISMIAIAGALIKQSIAQLPY